MKIALIEPFFSGSHRSWALELQQHSAHTIELFTLPGSFWKWRMSGGAASLAKQFLESKTCFDLILATSLLDLPTFLGLSRAKSATTPTVLYFHENQLAYPWSTQDVETKRRADQHYIMKNITSLLAADRVLFNSAYNKESLLSGVPAFFSRFPDQNSIDIEPLEKKSQVVAVGLTLDDIHRDAPKSGDEAPLVLWNHRWEYDKNPMTFFRVLERLSDDGVAFRLAVVGEEPLNPKSEPFFSAREKLSSHIDAWGYCSSREEYVSLLEQTAILPVTNKQEFFGISVMEAVYAGAIPLLPQRLSYPFLFDTEANSDYFYTSEEQLYQKLKALLEGRKELPSLSYIPEKYAWQRVIKEYDSLFSSFKPS